MRLLNEDQTADLEVSPETLQLEARAVTDMRGVGIASIVKTSTEGLVDTYTITYTDGRTQTYEVTNGAEGPQGPKGDKGPRGYPGFSAYQYATMGGYEGTEEEFIQLMASNATMAETVEYYSWTEEIKTALMACFENVAWVNENGQTYYDALYAALYDRTWSVTNVLTGCRNTNTMTAITKGRPYNGILERLPGYTMDGAVVTITMGGEDVSSYYSSGTISIPSVTGNVVITATAAALVPIAISAVYTQSVGVYDTDSLDVLKADLVVTAEYADSTSAVVTDYTLSGTLAEGTSTITVTYQGLTDTFNVTVTAVVYLYKEGDECTSLTGGYTKRGFISNASRVTYSNTGECLSFVLNATASSQTAASLTSVNKIDFTNYESICFDNEFYRQNSAKFNSWAYFADTVSTGTSIASAYGSSYIRNFVGSDAYPRIRRTQEKSLASLSLTGEKYVSFNVNGFNSEPAGDYIKYYNVYLKPKVTV